MPWIKQQNTVSTGKATEQFAAEYLTKQGLVLQSNNFHNRGGEIDLIMTDQEIWVFIEVKYRRNNNFGGAISAISIPKQKKIRQCATYYLHKAGLNEYNTPCRFDVIALQGEISNPKVNWLKNAF